MHVADEHHSTWVTCFQEQGEILLGVSAQELGEAREERKEKFDAILQKLGFKSYFMKLRVKLDKFYVSFNCSFGERISRNPNFFNWSNRIECPVLTRICLVRLEYSLNKSQCITWFIYFRFIRLEGMIRRLEIKKGFIFKIFRRRFSDKIPVKHLHTGNNSRRGMYPL